LIKTRFLQIDDDGYQEKRETGKIKLNTFLIYFTTVLGYFGPLFIILLFVSCQALLAGCDYWLAFW
jgi:hypothetical protein